jgi:hypothetical protein
MGFVCASGAALPDEFWANSSSNSSSSVRLWVLRGPGAASTAARVAKAIDYALRTACGAQSRECGSR